MYAWQFCQMNNIAKQRGWTEFVGIQNMYSAVYREDERELGPYSQYAGKSWMSFCSLSGGFLARPPGVNGTVRGTVNPKHRSPTDVMVSPRGGVGR
jgi:aryl-alcohol dehydrogenase-like predicted oxidoreductase